MEQGTFVVLMAAVPANVALQGSGFLRLRFLAIGNWQLAVLPLGYNMSGFEFCDESVRGLKLFAFWTEAR